ncbi:MAG: class I adenylate cyclase [Thermodesulfobacteriota bacterium]
MPVSLAQRLARYVTYNRNRLDRAIAFDPDKANLFFKIVPFLLHTNHPDLPGYLADPAAPCGVHGFDPLSLSRELFWRAFPGASTGATQPTPTAGPPAVLSLATVGSIGTIAQTTKSDCDYWVTIDAQALGTEGRAFLERKCQGIEEWCAKKGAEVHFFLMDAAEIRENRFSGDAEKESAGSALRQLLKDELFRSHILVAGKILLWWLIPPGLSDQQYRACVARMETEPGFDPGAFVDLGYVSGIPRAEIFGACLWQMNKALDSPFKSVLKFAYLEVLLQQTASQLPLFSDSIKCLVTFPDLLSREGQEVLELTEVDPYLLLARSVVSFYQQQSRTETADFIRKCLFLKTIEGMQSQIKRAAPKSGLPATTALMKRWDLLPEDLGHYLAYRSWRYRELVELGGTIHAYLADTYKGLREIFQSLAAAEGITITERDISVLGRKLFTFYEKKPNKIEYIKSPSRQAMEQEHISILITKVEGRVIFYAFQGKHDRKSIRDKIDYVIRREDNLISLVVWMAINGVLSSRTELHLSSDYSLLDLTDIQQLTQAILQFFPTLAFSQIAAEDLVKAERVTRALAVVNMTKQPVKGAKAIPSSLITVNSYGEYFIQHVTTVTQLKNLFRVLLTKHFVSRWNKNLEIFLPPQPEARLLQSMLEG